MDKNEKSILYLQNILSEYVWLLDAYNVDYFINDHWGKVPLSWQKCLQTMPVSEIGSILQAPSHGKYLFPLTLQCLRVISSSIRAKRSQNPFKSPFTEESNSFSSKPSNNVQHILCRGVKLKKRHEIDRLSMIIPALMRTVDVDSIIDCGAGQGHLSRILQLCHGYQVFSVDGNRDHVQGATVRDDKVSRALAKHNQRNRGQPNNQTQSVNNGMPAKVNCFIEDSHTIDQLVGGSIGHHLLLGLHPCGSLSNLIIEQFVKNIKSKCLVLASCCYMKAEEHRQENLFQTVQTHRIVLYFRFPMSRFISNQSTKFSLSIQAKELACHAVEKFIDKFLSNEQMNSLKVHGYRACLELLIARYDPTKRHSAMRNVRITPNMTFQEYIQVATKDLDIRIPQEALDSQLVRECMQNVDRVVIFYCLRLLVAPLIEMLILLDYQQFVSENPVIKHVELIPLFDPLISPRNFILVAHKWFLIERFKPKCFGELDGIALCSQASPSCAWFRCKFNKCENSVSIPPVRICNWKVNGTATSSVWK